MTLRKTGKTKVDSELSMKAVNSAKRKRVEEAMDLGQGDDRLPGTDRILTDEAMVPPITHSHGRDEENWLQNQEE